MCHAKRSSKRASDVCVTALSEANRDMAACFCKRTGSRSIVDVPASDMSLEETRNERRTVTFVSIDRYAWHPMQRLAQTSPSDGGILPVLSQPSWQIFGSQTCKRRSTSSYLFSIVFHFKRWAVSSLQLLLEVFMLNERITSPAGNSAVRRVSCQFKAQSSIRLVAHDLWRIRQHGTCP